MSAQVAVYVQSKHAKPVCAVESFNVGAWPVSRVCRLAEGRLHTGFADLILELRKNPDPQLLHHTCSGLDGRDGKLLQWITDSGLAALIADNYAVEIIPQSPFKPMQHAAMPLHEHCLFKNGIHLGEIWYLSELARWLRENGRNRFLLTAPPLRLPGAVGSPATPVATV